MNALRSLMVGILALLALITVPITALAAAVDPGLIGLWHMDNDWKDASGAGNDGTPNNGVSFSTSAKVGTAAGSFDGLNDFVSIANTDFLNQSTSGAISVELWAKSNIDWSLHNGWAALINKQSESQSGFAMHIHSSNPTVFFEIITYNGDYEAVSNNLVKNQWYHFVGTYDGSSIKLYQDGILVQSSAASGKIKTNNLNMEIGRWRNSYGEYFNGLIDEVSIYSRALSDTEVQQHYLKYVVNYPTVNPVPSPTVTPTITLSGTKPANTAIAVNGNTLVTLDGMTSWQTSYTLSQGTNTISVTALDSQNRNSLPVTMTVVLDTTPPQVTATTPTNNAILKTAPGAVTFSLADALTPLDYTTTLNGAKVTNASGFTIAGTWSNSGSGTTGTITFTPSAALSDESYSATIKPTDIVANGSTYTLTFTVDSMPPVAPGIDPVTAPINTTSKTITGTKSSDSASVAVNCTGATIGTISYPTATTWSVNVSGLKEGSNTITAYAVDAAGNQSGAATATITVDTTPPAVGASPAGGIYNSTQSVALAANESAVIYYTTDGSTPTASATIYSQPISIPADATLKYFGRDPAGNNSEINTENYVIDTVPPVLTVSTLSGGSYTNREIMNIAGTATDNTGIKDLRINDVSVPVNSEGNFSYAMLLQSGPNTITAIATDLANNQTSDTRTINLDLTAPNLNVTAPADNSKTGTALTEVKGTVDDVNATVTVRLGDSTQTAILTGNDFVATVLLAPKDNTIEITATDLASNTSSQKRSVFYDDQKPSLAITEPNQDIRTNQSTLTIRGTASDPYGLTVTVSIDMDGQTYSPALVNGEFEQLVTFTEQKSYAIVVTATNEVKTSTSAQRNVIYDITPPSLTIDPVTSPTSQPNQVVTGTMESGAPVTVTCPTATVGSVTYPTATTWSVNITNMTLGDNTITATATDLSNNTSTASADIVYKTTPTENTFDFAVFGNTGITMTGGSYTDSYISNPPHIIRGQYKHGDVGTNSTKPCSIKLSSGTQVFGKAWVGVGGNPATGICLSCNSSVYRKNTGSLTSAKDMTPKTDPGGGKSMGALKLSDHRTKTLPPGDYRYSSISLSGDSTLNLSGPSIIHIDGDLKVSGGRDGYRCGPHERSEGSRIVVTSGAVTIYANGKKIDFSGGSLINNTQDPKNLTIYGTARLQSVNLSGESTQHLLLYAPTAAITLSGGQDTFGSVVGSSVNLSGRSSVHYDELLSH